MSCFVALVWMNIIPLWLVVILIVRDVWIMSGVLAYRTIIGPIDFVPAGISKVNNLFANIPWSVDFGRFRRFPCSDNFICQAIMYAVLVTTIVSFATTLGNGVDALNSITVRKILIARTA